MTNRKARPDRRKRTPMGKMRLTMDIDKRTKDKLRANGMMPRWVNDTGDRTRQLQEGGYDFVTNTGETTIEVGEKPQDNDTLVKTRVGTTEGGAPMYAYLMAIPIEYYEEDAAAKEEECRRVDDAIRAGRPRGAAPHNIPSNQGGVSVNNVDYKP